MLKSDIKALFKVLFMFLPLPVFWTLFDQQVFAAFLTHFMPMALSIPPENRKPEAFLCFKGYGKEPVT